MYALINGQELLLGPISFNYRMINSVLEEDLEVEFRVTSQDYQSVPLSFTEDIKILQARNEVPEHDSRFQSVSQTSHTITDTEVVFSYGVYNCFYPHNPVIYCYTGLLIGRAI